MWNIRIRLDTKRELSLVYPPDHQNYRILPLSLKEVIEAHEWERVIGEEEDPMELESLRAIFKDQASKYRKEPTIQESSFIGAPSRPKKQHDTLNSQQAAGSVLNSALLKKLYGEKWDKAKGDASAWLYTSSVAADIVRLDAAGYKWDEGV
eukprot:CAMPEP_0197534646 /NCGR_PEP_ID=MMETSP1318-20131121/47861_1 /TAXON_ID=552666 /ORGANISM="Partenskyella glossopodia, Strain RCC365" /LENGTH=150 /DNA_ID=CAMNT_0043091991 /DNA_START=143 /DNA_END=595 /DNA_ORIENTATION=-